MKSAAVLIEDGAFAIFFLFLEPADLKVNKIFPTYILYLVPMFTKLGNIDFTWFIKLLTLSLQEAMSDIIFGKFRGKLSIKVCRYLQQTLTLSKRRNLPLQPSCLTKFYHMNCCVSWRK